LNTLFPVSLVASLVFAFPALSRGADVTVHNPDELRAAVAAATPGTRILLTEGSYGGGFHFTKLRGEPGKPIVLASADPQKPAVFERAKTGLQLSAPAYVELRDLHFFALFANGLNIDDGGLATGPGAHHIVLQGLRIGDIGGGGNEDGIKLSGVSDFSVTDCTIERWGAGGGSAIDMVGCHRGVVERSLIRHNSPPNATGVQCKGGSSEIAIRGSRFEFAGGRAVNIGGSTGRQFFRPALQGDTGHAEARAITVEGNTFVGAMTPVAFAGADGGVVRFNTIERPGRWALRIVQENRTAGFVPCRNGIFSDNVIIYDSARWSEGGVNVGAGTAAESFTFARNWWYCADRPQRSQPKLPNKETAGVYGRDPALAKGIAGADAWKSE
jgi:hypothetical protein